MTNLRFGGIENFDEVKRFFAERSLDTLDRLHSLREVSKAEARQHIIEIKFDRSDRQLTVIAAKALQDP